MNAPAQVKLGDCVKLAKGKPPTQQPYYGADSAWYLSPEYLRGAAACERAKPRANAVHVQDGNTILLWDGSNAGEIFLGRDGMLASTMTLVSPDNRFTPDYFFFALKQWEPYLKGQTSGSGIPHVDKEVLGKLEITEFAEPEQSKIADVLSTVDRAIAQTEALIAKQQRIKTGLMQDLLTRGIDEHGQLRSEATHTFKDSPLGHIPVEWDVVPLHELADAVDPQPDHRTPPEHTGGVPYIGVSDIGDQGKIDFHNARKVSASVLEKQRRAFSIDQGDFIFGKIGTIGMPTRIPATGDYTLSANIILLKPNATPEYVYWWMASPVLMRMIKNELHTTSQPAFGIQKIRALKISRPKRLERGAIGSALDKIEKCVIEAETEHKKLLRLKTALMQDLLTGKVRVTPLLQQTEEAASA